MSGELLITTETELLEVETLQQELLEDAQQGPPGVDGETIVSASVVGDQIQLQTNLGRTLLVAGSVRGATGDPGITVSATPPLNPQINDLWLQIPGP